MPGCCRTPHVLAAGVARFPAAQAEQQRLGSRCSCCAGCFGFHGRNNASGGIEGTTFRHWLVHQALDLLHLPALRPYLLGVPSLQLPFGLGLLRCFGHRHQPDPAWDAARWGSSYWLETELDWTCSWGSWAETCLCLYSKLSAPEARFSTSEVCWKEVPHASMA